MLFELGPLLTAAPGPFDKIGVRLRPVDEVSLSAEHRMGVSLTETKDQTVIRGRAASGADVETTTSETVVGTGTTGFFVGFHF